jgi:hypothetical protein
MANALQTVHTVVRPRQIAYGLSSVIGRIVVDEDDFPGYTGKASVQSVHELLDIASLVDGGCDDGRLWTDPGL